MNFSKQIKNMIKSYLCLKYADISRGDSTLMTEEFALRGYSRNRNSNPWIRQNLIGHQRFGSCHLKRISNFVCYMIIVFGGQGMKFIQCL